MPCLILPNLLATQGVWSTSPAAHPSLSTPAALRGVPKADRAKAQADPAGADYLITFVESVTQKDRPSITHPPHAIHGAVVDLDCKEHFRNKVISPRSLADELIRVIGTHNARGGYARYPSWVYQTPGGGMRVVWEFPTPILVDARLGQEEAPRLADYTLREFINAHGMDPATFRGKNAWLRSGLKLPADEHAVDPKSASSNMLWASVPDWEPCIGVHDPLQPTWDPVRYQIAAADRAQPQLPPNSLTLEDANLRLEEAFPGMKQYLPLWEDQPLPAFFDTDMSELPSIDHSKNRRCRVRSWGIMVHTTSTGAITGGYRWSELLRRVLKQSQQANITALIKSFARVHLAEKKMPDPNYLIADPTGNFIGRDKAFTLSWLAEAGLDHRIPKGDTLSPAAMFLKEVDQHRRVVSMDADPYATWAVREIPGHPGELELNVLYEKFRLQVPSDAAAPAEFPNIVHWLRAALDTGAMMHFLAWLKVAYESAYNRNCVRGQVCILAGPRDTGKTTFLRNVIYPMFHSDRPASAFDNSNADWLAASDSSGTGRWTSEAVKHHILHMDDQGEAMDARTRKTFTSKVRQLAGSGTFRSEGKFEAPMNVAFKGRFIFLGNDETMAACLPELKANAVDKFSFYLCKPRDGSPRDPGLGSKMRRELPKFCRWLLDWQPPASIWDTRADKFMSAPYYEPTLYEQGRTIGDRSHLVDCLLEFRKQCHAHALGTATGNVNLISEIEGYDKATNQWTGSATALHGFMKTMGILNDNSIGARFMLANVTELVANQASCYPWLTLHPKKYANRAATLSVDCNPCSGDGVNDPLIEAQINRCILLSDPFIPTPSIP